MMILSLLAFAKYQLNVSQVFIRALHCFVQSSVAFVGIVMIMLRLREYQTDLVITISVPHMGGQYDMRGMDLSEGKLGSLMESANIMKDAIAHSLECVDFSFIVKEEDKD
jgi:hypothetical protein